MKKVAKRLIRFFLKTFPLTKIYLGKNRGFVFEYNEDLNLDMMLGFHEPNTFEIFDTFIKKGMIVADIGANIGYFSKFLSGKVGEAGKVFCFEPIPQTFKRLEKTISLNSLKNVLAVNIAASNNSGIAKMFLSKTHYMSSLDSGWAGDNGGEINVSCTTLDDFFKNQKFYPDFIKMDIEGGGVYALQGMVECIKENQPILFLESHTSEEDLAIGKALSLIPYEVYRVGDNNEVKYLDKDYTNINGIYGTIIAIPKSRKNHFENWSPEIFQRKKFGQR